MFEVEQIGGWVIEEEARRMIATESFWSGLDDEKLGHAYDIEDAVVVRVPQYFNPALEPDEAA